MAILRFGLVVTGIRGSIGGTTYSANKSGAYAKAWAPAINPRTPFQSNERRVLSWVASEWRNLTGAQRTGWNTWAALLAQVQTNSLGVSYYLSGFQWFVKVNIRLELMGRAWLVAAPVLGYPAQPNISWIVTAQTAGGGSQKVLYPNGEFVGFDFVSEVAVSQDVGHTVQHSGFYATHYDQAPGATQTWIGIGMRAKLGFAVTGNTYWGRCYRQNTSGLRSPAGTISGVCT